MDVDRIAQKYGAPRSNLRLLAAMVALFALACIITYIVEQDLKALTNDTVVISAVFAVLSLLAGLGTKRGLLMLTSVFLGILVGALAIWV